MPAGPPRPPHGAGSLPSVDLQATSDALGSHKSPRRPTPIRRTVGRLHLIVAVARADVSGGSDLPRVARSGNHARQGPTIKGSGAARAATVRRLDGRDGPGGQLRQS